MSEAQEKKPQHSLRFDNEQMVEVLDAYSVSVRQTRNAAILTIIEGFLRSKNLWPPQSPADQVRS